MPYRKMPLAQGEIYHVFTKSIAGFKIFNSDKAYLRMIDTIAFYTLNKPPCKFSLWQPDTKPDTKPALDLGKDEEKIVRILAYCLMPTHIHLILEQLKEKGISRFVNLILKSYSKYFNESHDRKGPLWEGRFKNVLVGSDEQLLHLTRYVHLNPVTSFLVNKPEDWQFSSYKEYMGSIDSSKGICNFSAHIDVDKSLYAKFVENQINYQRELRIIKHLILE